ncbi:MAG: 3-deoxy-7-phosphoheptulonate synthase [Deltaproteobacteria bacterium]|jgi:3-deoxy-7-phosphoheptulonate synthase|nr:3-deoxy-7-phosphoheptulonate synthase [Deltaproteobacteria bacterium]MBW2512405.1 3-deoxy-7-phosphoheptulonate synthase [Deltaproteobacteria bacterium]
MVRTNNLNVSGLTPLIAPADLKQVLPLSEEDAEFVAKSRAQVQDILWNRDPRMMVVIGPCSIHDPKAAIEYAERLAKLNSELHDQLLLVMRVYFEKPRTTIGWKGLINDPDLNGTHLISKGLGIARRLMLNITAMGLPVATEMLDPITPQYMADTISWGAIGARTTESQTHREMSSGLSFPVGFKNGTDGNLQIAIDAMGAACHPHSFLGINREGRTSIVRTTGNPDVHIVLRGGNDKPNYTAADIAQAEKKLDKAGIKTTLMVDCSHANSLKDHNRQEAVMQDVMEQVAAGNAKIGSLMIESFLKEGNQKMADKLEDLEYGVSITDKCVSWETTERMMRHAHATLKACGGRKI